MAPASSRAQTTNGNFVCAPFTTEFFSACTGETVEVVDSELCVAHQSHVDAAGGIHTVEQFRTRIDGVGTVSGRRYTQRGTTTEVVNIGIPTNGQEVQTFVEDAHINTPGPDNNMKVKMFFHLAINANGELGSFNSDFKEVCQ